MGQKTNISIGEMFVFNLKNAKSGVVTAVVRFYFTVTDFARFLGLSGSSFLCRAM